MQSLSSEFDLHENELVGEWFPMKTRFDREEKGNLEMAYHEKVVFFYSWLLTALCVC